MPKQQITPKILKNICMNAHPLGSKMLVDSQIDYVKKTISVDKTAPGPKNVLIVGGSAGYGLASRIVAAFGYGAKTLSVALENPAMPEKKRPATIGWYNTRAFEARAQKEGLWTKSLYGDAFSKELKKETLDVIRNEMGKIDLLVYSLAAPKRIDPETGVLYSSVLKTIGSEFTGTTINVIDKSLYDVTVTPANEEEIEHTVQVMGGGDWELWTNALIDASLFAENSYNVAYSYIGPVRTQALYRHGTIGKAKEDLEYRAHVLDKRMQEAGLGRSYVSVNKALVTRASSVIPVVPLYLAILYKVMKEKSIHETCIEQISRLCTDRLYGGLGVKTDEEQRIRMDDWEMREDVQAEVEELWKKVTAENVDQTTDIDGFQKEFYNIHGFMWDNIDYSEEVEL